MESRSRLPRLVDVSGASPWGTANDPSSRDRVVLERSHFESLLRRANFYTDNNVIPIADDIVMLSRSDYEQRVLMEGKYYRLCRALLAGGVTPFQLAALVTEDDPAKYYTTVEQNSPQRTSNELPGNTSLGPFSTTEPGGPSRNTQTSGSSNSAFLVTQLPRLSTLHRTAVSTDITHHRAPDSDNLHSKERTPSPFDAALPTPSEKRTVFFGNLSDKTTYADLVNIIRGGSLSDIHLRLENHCATASFIEGASEFVAYAKRNDFYLHQKRIDIRWNDRQFIIPTHIAGRIRRGATRNFVIYNGHPRLDEGTIRADMEHIHNLAIISVTVRGSDIYVSTNSIHHATVARACMASRQPYRGLQIGWYQDECATPLPNPRKSYLQLPDRVAARKSPVEMASMANRFGLLSCDGDDDSKSVDDLYDDVTSFGEAELDYGVEGVVV